MICVQIIPYMCTKNSAVFDVKKAYMCTKNSTVFDVKKAYMCTKNSTVFDVKKAYMCTKNSSCKGGYYCFIYTLIVWESEL